MSLLNPRTFVQEHLGFNTTGLSGAIDVIVIAQPDGSLKSTPFHVRYAAIKCVRAKDKTVLLRVNGQLVDGVRMKLGSAGEAYFVRTTSEEVPAELAASPIVSPMSSPDASPTVTPRVLSREQEEELARDSLGLDGSPGEGGVEPELHWTWGGMPTEEQPAPPDDLELPQELPQQPPPPGSWWGSLFGRKPPAASPPPEALLEAVRVEEAPAGEEPQPVSSARGGQGGTPGTPTEEDSLQEVPLTRMRSASEPFHTPKGRRPPPEELEVEGAEAVLASLPEEDPSGAELSEHGEEEEEGESGPGDGRLMAELLSWAEHGVKPGTLQLSMCGSTLAPCDASSDPQANQLFESHLVCKEEFEANPRMMSHPELMVRVAHCILPWRPVQLALVSAVAFGQPISEQALARIITAAPSRRGWSLWPFSSSKPAPPSPPAASPRAEPPVPEEPGEQPAAPNKIRTLIPSSAELQAMHLKPGQNTIEFEIAGGRFTKASVGCFIFLWPHDAKIIVSDVDGTITRSDVLGQILPQVGVDWSHPGVTALLRAIVENNYHVMYLTSRALGQAHQTRGYLQSVEQGEHREGLPPGPVVMSPDGLIVAFTREVILRRPEEFKIACLRNIASLFPAALPPPFYAGFGNRITDVISYRAVGVPDGKIFIINPNGEVQNGSNSATYKKTYTMILELKDQMFPAINRSVVTYQAEVPEEYNSSNFWGSGSFGWELDEEDLL